ncbi:hypothetical protein [Actinoallomurus iriomotensis]|nr:hypothetical protein [Actinoallomurus iriomotensis]
MTPPQPGCPHLPSGTAGGTGAAAFGVETGGCGADAAGAGAMPQVVQ